MGTVELLTREGEIAIAKRIEEGIREVQAAVAYFPGTVEHLLEAYALASSEGRLSDLLVGYLDPTDDVPQAAQVDHTAKTEGDEEEKEEDKGVITSYSIHYTKLYDIRR